MASEKKEVFVYQLRVWLREISPAIWRRLLIRSDSTIADLHYTIQIAMGWTDFHLHQFIIRGKRYGVSKIGGIWFADDPRQVKLESITNRGLGSALVTLLCFAHRRIPAAESIPPVVIQYLGVFAYPLQKVH